jgi:hypothetical protein
VLVHVTESRVGNQGSYPVSVCLCVTVVRLNRSLDFDHCGWKDAKIVIQRPARDFLNVMFDDVSLVRIGDERESSMSVRYSCQNILVDDWVGGSGDLIT